MATITAALVKDLREKTGAGMMDCKKALAENGGDLEAAGDWNARRQAQQLRWMWAMVEERLLQRLHQRTRDLAQQLEAQVQAGTLTAALAAEQLLAAFDDHPAGPTGA